VSRPLAHTPVATLRVDAVSEVIGRRRQVVVTKTGRAVWLPASALQLHPGRVTLPAWLAEKILTPDELKER
jgi:hypothetical protein